MTPVPQAFRVMRYAMANAFADLKTAYSWRTWLFGWLGRMLAQVVFFTALGKITGGAETVQFLIVGNAVMTSAVEAMFVVASTTWERAEGTLPFLFAAPSNLTWVFVGRSIQWVISGSGTSAVALLVLGPLFGVTWSPLRVPAVLLLVLLTASTTYCFGLFLAALVLNASAMRNLVSNTAYLVMMAICGVQVPATYWPAGIQWVADALPLTYCVAAVRRLAAGAPAQPVLVDAFLGLAVGMAWLAAAWVAFGTFAARARRAGTIDFVV